MCQESLIRGQGSLVSGLIPLVRGQGSLVSGHRSESSVSSQRSLVRSQSQWSKFTGQVRGHGSRVSGQGS